MGRSGGAEVPDLETQGEGTLGPMRKENPGASKGKGRLAT